MDIFSKISLSLIILGASCLMAAGAMGQNDNDGQLGRQSTGRISLALEITERANPILTLVDSSGAPFQLPAFLENQLSQSLTESGVAQFPLCMQDTGSGAASVSLDSAPEEMILTGPNGETIRYEVNIVEMAGETDVNGTRPGNSEPSGCEEGSQMTVEISILDDLPASGQSQLTGQFRLMISPE